MYFILQFSAGFWHSGRVFANEVTKVWGTFYFRAIGPPYCFGIELVTDPEIQLFHSSTIMLDFETRDHCLLLFSYWSLSSFNHTHKYKLFLCLTHQIISLTVSIGKPLTNDGVLLIGATVQETSLWAVLKGNGKQCILEDVLSLSGFEIIGPI